MENLNKTRAFLTEFIIVILFFSVAAVIAITMYVNAYQKNEDSENLSKASLQVQSVAENIRAGNEVCELSNVNIEYLDEDMNKSEDKEAQYVQIIEKMPVSDTQSGAGELVKYIITIKNYDSMEEIYSLTVIKYNSKEVQ